MAVSPSHLDPAGSRRDEELVGRLLAWYATAKRTLPWRSLPTPYRVWVSEIMLQQTQVDTVIPYFERWLRRFPDIARLAAAGEDDVMAAWSGLGYYRRARLLHQAARIVCDRHAGRFPVDHDAMLALPGIGDYTAGAIASIAFGQRRALVDTHVARVVARVFGLPGDVTKGPLRREIWAVAARLVPATAPGDFNQAVMELGALVCTARSPECTSCPLNGLCHAQRHGLQAEIPAPKVKSLRHREVGAGLIIPAGPVAAAGIVVVRRAGEGLLGGLWDLPTVRLWQRNRAQRTKQEPDLSLEGALRGAQGRAMIACAAWESLGLRLEPVCSLAPIPHTFSHIDYTLVPWQCSCARAVPQLRAPPAPHPLVPDYDAWRIATDDELRELGMPRMSRKALVAWRQHSASSR